MARKFFVIGNWKMNGSISQARDLVSDLNKIEVPVNTVAAQNTYTKPSGAYTGEISPQMIKDIGAKWIIVGHPERREHFKESDEFVSEKARFALDAGLSIVICVGEKLADREAGLASQIISHQMKSFAQKIQDWTNVVIAYEPLWTIGTGKAATPEQAQEILQYIRHWLRENVSYDTAQKTRILYCGSVNGKNCKEFANKPDVDGFLVGHACLRPEFASIVRARQQEGTQGLRRKRLIRQCRNHQDENRLLHKKKRV
ncbi:triosephosphate isomerase [Sporodiniella umbellata]|nr:triosephosphate isomerase [Sporodiniella umbellata]